MKHQIAAAAGLAAVMAFCGYMIAQLNAERAPHGAAPVTVGVVASR